MKKILIPVLSLMLLGGCETLGLSEKDKAAAIEDRGAAQTAGKPAADAGGAATSALGAGALDAKALGGPAGDPRKDPSSPLSRRSVYFDFDSFAVKDEYRTTIEAHAAYLNATRNARVTIQGNADERGSREYNLALGQKRAQAVLRSLSTLGVQDSQLEAVSFGEEKPRGQGGTEQAHAENRRADIVYGDE